MKKYLVISVICSSAFMIFIYALVNNGREPYSYNKKFHVDSHRVSPSLRIKIERIKKDSLWMHNIKKTAKVRGLTIPAMIEIEANSLMAEDLYFEEQESREQSLISRIKNDSIWFYKVKKQALDEGVSEEEMILRSVKFIMSKDDK